MTSDSRLSIIGVTRFSMVLESSINSFRATKGKTLTEAKEAVWQQDRLEKRMWFFKTFCLPSYRQNSLNSPAAHGVLLVNSDFPLLERLRALCANVQNLEVLTLNDDQNHRDLLREHTMAITKPKQRVFSFRYDDDDALSADYVPLIEKHAETTDDDQFISFNTGFSLRKLPDGMYGMHLRKFPLNAFGLGVLSHRENLRIILEGGGHGKVKDAVKHDMENPGWLAPVHDGNDSHVGEYKHKTISESEMTRRVAKRFPHLDASEVAKIPVVREPDVKMQK